MVKAMVDYANSQGFEALLNAHSEACKQSFIPLRSDKGDIVYGDKNGNTYINPIMNRASRRVAGLVRR